MTLPFVLSLILIINMKDCLSSHQVIKLLNEHKVLDYPYFSPPPITIGNIEMSPT